MRNKALKNIENLLNIKQCKNLKGKGWSIKSVDKKESKLNSEIIKYNNKKANVKGVIKKTIIGNGEYELSLSVNNKNYNFIKKNLKELPKDNFKRIGSSLKGSLEELKRFLIITALYNEDEDEALKYEYKNILNEILNLKYLAMQEKRNKNIYQNKDWIEFRKKVLNLNNNNCYCGENKNNRPFIFQENYNPNNERYNPKDAILCCDICHPEIIKEDYNKVLKTLKKEVNNKDAITILETYSKIEFEKLSEKKKKDFENNKDYLIGCEMCGRNKSDGVILQVHHKHYDDSLNIHEYKRSDLMILCKGCHAREHGFLEPNNGWILESKYDLDDLIGECNRQKSKSQDVDEICEQAIRYEHSLYHPKGYTRVVGSTCVKHMVLTEPSQKVFKSLTNETPEKKIKSHKESEKYIKMNKSPFMKLSENYEDLFINENVKQIWLYGNELKNDTERYNIEGLIKKYEEDKYELSLLINGIPLLFKRKSFKDAKQEITFYKDSLDIIKEILISYSYYYKEKLNENEHLVKLWKDYLIELKSKIKEYHGVEILNDELGKQEQKKIFISKNMINYYTIKYCEEIIPYKLKDNVFRYIENRLEFWKEKRKKMWVLNVKGLNFNFKSGFQDDNLFENKLFFYDDKLLDQLVLFMDIYYRAINNIPMKGKRNLISEELKLKSYEIIKSIFILMMKETKNYKIKSEIM